MVFFNDPVRCEDGPLRAIRMSVAMRSRVRTLAEGWARQGHDLAMGIGIAQGYATLGKIGFDSRLDYAAIGPEHAFYRERNRIEFAHSGDDEVLEVFQLCSRLEGIIPALESTHALVHGLKRARQMKKDEVLVINLSGRGDKDVQQVRHLLGSDK